MTWARADVAGKMTAAKARATVERRAWRMEDLSEFGTGQIGDMQGEGGGMDRPASFEWISGIHHS